MFGLFLGLAALGGALFGASQAKKARKAEPAPLPIPDPPIAQGQAGGAVTDIENKFIKAGRGGTILTGQLTPTKIGKKRLLG